MLATFRTALAAIILIGGAVHAATPISRSLGDQPGAAKARLKNQPRVPAPTMNVLTASLDAQGQVVIRCSEAENPAFRRWREQITRRGEEQN